MNIYVREAFRNKSLEATADGKPVYYSLGFKDMPNTMKCYDTEIWNSRSAMHLQLKDQQR